jgi:hypothetical protein
MQKINKLPFKLREFLAQHAYDFDKRDFAKSVGMTEKHLQEIISGEVPSEKDYAETVIAMTVIEAKGWSYWEHMSQGQKSELAAKFIAAGGSTMTVGGMIAVISACGVPGLSAAGIASGLAAIGALVGGGMVAGITVCSAAPLVVGGVLYAACKKGKKPVMYFKKKMFNNRTNRTM